MLKRLNPRRAKIHRNYTVEEIAGLYGVHKNTVRRWIKSGLAVCDSQRPTLILGSELRRYLEQQRAAKKRACKPSEIYCMRCRQPRRPVGDMVDYFPEGGSHGRLVGICPTCSGMMNRYTSETKLVVFAEHLEVAMPAPKAS